MYIKLFWQVDPELIGHAVQVVGGRMLVEDVRGRRTGGSPQSHKARMWKGWYLSRDPWNTHSIFFPLFYRPKNVNKTEEIL